MFVHGKFNVLKHSSLLGPFVSYKENKESRINILEGQTSKIIFKRFCLELSYFVFKTVQLFVLIFWGFLINFLRSLPSNYLCNLPFPIPGKGLISFSFRIFIFCSKIDISFWINTYFYFSLASVVEELIEILWFLNI